MRIEQNYSLKNHNTFHISAKTRWFMEYHSEAELDKILADEYFQECVSLHIGSGSNLLFLNDFDGVIFHSQIKGKEIVHETESEILLRVGAGESWNELTQYVAEKGWGGIENLAGIPGEVGSAAVQNIGAYGIEIMQVLTQVEAYNQLTRKKKLFTVEECAYDYRSSRFKDDKRDPYIITYVTLRLSKTPLFDLQYDSLSQRLEEKKPLTVAKVREEVLALRAEKLPDPAKLGNAGSFFKNPLVSQEVFYPLHARYHSMPFYPSSEGKLKIPAAWLIEKCGFKGKRHGEVGVYDKQALVLVNYGEASGDEIALVAESIRMAVQERFGITLIPEVKYVS